MAIKKKTKKTSSQKKETPKKKQAAKKAPQKSKKQPLKTPEKHIKEVERKVVTPEPVIKTEPVKAEPEKKKIIIETPDIIVKDLADKLGIKTGELIKALMIKGVLATINQRIEPYAAKEVASEFNIDVEVKLKPKEEQNLKPKQLVTAGLQTRNPVVTIMGHVDHGKTKLLDTIRNTNVIAKESGGITQHIGAYQAEVKGRKITFLDTPGHAAFTALRARGAKVTDIAILIVAADDGVMPQTIEAIDHAKAAGVPIIVAINKIDKPEANLDRVKKQLAEYGLSPEEWGGDTVTCQISAKLNKGIDELLEMIILVADMLELKADPNILANGIVIESKMDKGRGPVATILVKSGTLRIGDSFAIGSTFGKIRALVDDTGKNKKEAGPSTPIELLGCSEVPQPGDLLEVVESDNEAREKASQKKEEIKQKVFTGKKISLEAFSKNIKEGQRKDLNLIIKADVKGSLEALNSSLGSLNLESIQVKIVHSGVGNINESDVMLAEASQAVIIGFHVSFDGSSKKLAEDEGVDVKIYEVIYNIVDDIKLALEGLLEPEYEEVKIGTAEVRTLYKFSKVGTIAGSFIKDGKFVRGGQIRIIRDGKKIFEGKLESLKRFKDDVKSVEKGYECGIAIMGYQDFKPGDQIEAFELRVKPRKKK